MFYASGRGFTLIELLIVITLTLIILVFVAGNYSQFFHSSLVDGEVDSLVSLLRLAKSKAIAEVNDSKFKVEISATTFTLKQEVGNIDLEIHRMNEQTKASSTSLPLSVTFEKLTGAVISCSPCTITIANTPTAFRQKSVVISDQGLITVQ